MITSTVSKVNIDGNLIINVSTEYAFTRILYIDKSSFLKVSGTLTNILGSGVIIAKDAQIGAFTSGIINNNRYVMVYDILIVKGLIQAPFMQM